MPATTRSAIGSTSLLNATWFSDRRTTSVPTRCSGLPNRAGLAGSLTHPGPGAVGLGHDGGAPGPRCGAIGAPASAGLAGGIAGYGAIGAASARGTTGYDVGD